MKSIFITFVMFIALFGILKLDIASVLDGFWFPIISFIIFITVIIIAVSIFGLPTKENFKSALKSDKEEVKNEEDN